MISVLVIGSTGYVGFPLCQSLVRSGAYKVYGLCRSSDKARMLVQHEIQPIRGDASNVSEWLSLLVETTIDIVIDTSTAYSHASSILSSVANASRQRLQTLAESGHLGSKKGFVYVSGTWIHGSPSDPVSDLHPVGSKGLSKGQPPEVSKWRVGHEQAILAAKDVLDVAIVRPGEVYGGKSWLFEDLWGPIVDTAKGEQKKKKSLNNLAGKVQIPIAEDARQGVVHVDDVASGIHAVVDRIFGGLGSWPVFDLVTETVDMRVLLEGVRAVVNCVAEIEMVGPGDNAFHQAMSMRAMAGTGERAKIVLGWEPKRIALLERLETFVGAFQSGREE